MKQREPKPETNSQKKIIDNIISKCKQSIGEHEFKQIYQEMK
jgi:hypothetical protein